MLSSRSVPIPPGTTTKASETIMKWCSREKNVLCSYIWPTKGFTSCSKGSSTRTPTERPDALPSTDMAPSLAACIRPGPPPVMMSQPSQGQLGGQALDLVVGIDTGRGPGRPEDAHAVVRPLRPPEPGQLADHLPQPAHRALQDLDGRVLVAQQDHVGLSMDAWPFAHRVTPPPSAPRSANSTTTERASAR